MSSFREQIQHTDIYLIDQILKGRFDHIKTVLDAGCGSGRNLPWFLENNVEVYGIDPDEDRLQQALLLPHANRDHFKLATAENISFSQSFDLIICNAVLHFAKNTVHFEQMLSGMWNSLSPGGIFFARLASDIGIETLVNEVGDRRYELPDGSTRFLINMEMLLHYQRKLGAELVEPIKTTNVQQLRCMTTWILRKK